MRISNTMIEKLSRVCMCLKCGDVDAEVRKEIAALDGTLSPADCRACGMMVEAERQTPDELKACIAPICLALRYDYLLEALKSP